MLDPNHLLSGAGTLTTLIIIGFIIFAESGLLVGFFLPGDTLLFPAGFFAAQGKLPLAGVLLVAWVGSILGNEVGYYIGKKTGPRLFRKKDGLVFRQEYIVKASDFYERHGGKTVLLARFLPVIRTFAPLVAGAAKMDRRKFSLYNVVGGGLWVTALILLGYWLGSKIPNIDHYILPAVGVATLFTFGPTVYHIAKDERLRVWLRGQFKRVGRRFKNDK
jgi:membrane-associated protein